MKKWPQWCPEQWVSGTGSQGRGIPLVRWLLSPSGHYWGREVVPGAQCLTPRDRAAGREGEGSGWSWLCLDLPGRSF